MKKHTSLFVVLATLIGAMPAVAATNTGARVASSADLTGAPATRTRTKVNYEKYETRTTAKTYDSKDAKNLYYTQPAKRSDLYKQYSNSQSNVRTTRSETLRTSLQRKYFLAHPFFQPLEGKFGSVTDLSYTMNSYDLDLTPVPLVINGVSYANNMNDVNASWDMKQFSIKEDFSYGITDRIAVLGMLKYDSSDYKFDWSLPETPDDKMDDSGLNMYGLGAQWRFVDNEKWIGTASAYYQYQKDLASNFVLDLKAGYKVKSSTIYGLVRGWYVDFKGTSYGNGIEGTTVEGNDAGIFVAYETDKSTAFYVEGGVGAFSVLDEDWTLNLEAVFGNYSWHNQGTIKGAIGWQPNDWFALNLYAKTAFYDSADGKDLSFWYRGLLLDTDGDDVAETYVNSWVQGGMAKVDNYSETTIGLQAIFTF